MHISIMNSSHEKSQKGLRAVCEQFEAVFVQSMLQSMRKTIPEGGLIERSNGQKWFEEFMDAETAKTLAEKNDLGIAQALYQEMSGLDGKDKDTSGKSGCCIQTKG
jgi:flagellar protein FlgJ